MKIGILSDSHGNMHAIRRAVATLGAVDLWLHAGDYSQDAIQLAEEIGIPVITVAGNTDGRTTAKVDEFIEVAGKKIWLTHGHRYHVKWNLYELTEWGLRYEVDLVVFGHTHLPHLSVEGSMFLLNPGSIGYPNRDDLATAALVDISPTEIQPKIMTIQVRR